MENEPTQGPPGGAPSRRNFFWWLTAGMSAVAAAVVGVPFIAYLVGVRKRTVHWVKLGPVNDFPLEETRLKTFDNPLGQPWDGMAAHTGVYVRYLGTDKNEKDQFLVFAVNCAHLGCPVTWFPQSGLFMCPCHGGVYYADGEHASGPPPRGLFKCVWRVVGKGETRRLEVQAPHFPTLQDTLSADDKATG